MKHSVIAVIALASCFGVNNAFANSHGNGSGSNSGAPAAHQSSTTTTVAPHLNPMPHLSGVNAYRPVVSYQGSMRTLNYPPVGNSLLRHQIHSNVSGLNSGYAFQHPGNFRQARSSTQGSALNAIGRNRVDPQASTRLRNWSGNVSSPTQAHLNHLNNCLHHHDHWWWRNHCVAIVFFDFGWWGWYDGWWYPAWGYDPYSYYEYNEPIYGYDGLSPEQIVAGVQAALQQRGYYTYAVDGKMGPLTRAAIASYQRDHRLPITSGIDPATLGSLGVIR
jgi:Putative peptidoglycan binding domain